MWMKRISVILITLAAIALTGCGNAVTSDFPNRLIGADGQRFVLDDLRKIANDSGLSEDEKIDAFHELGIEDEKLIGALLELPEDD